MAAPAIETKGLTKMFGKVRAVEGVDLKIDRGEVFAFLGPNGAGKTTTIRMLLDLIRPTQGEARIAGYDCQRQSIEVRRRSSYLPGELSLPEGVSARHFLNHVARLRGESTSRAMDSLADRLGLSLDRPIGDLSKGNKQKVGLIAAFMVRAEVLILDEPASGLDPLRQHDVQEMIRERTAAGHTIFLSSHALDQVEHVADRVGVIREGRLVAVEAVDSLKAKALRHVEVRFAGPTPVDRLRAVRGVEDLSAVNGTACFAVQGSMDPLIKELARYPVRTITSEEPELDQIFLAYYGDRK